MRITFEKIFTKQRLNEKKSNNRFTRANLCDKKSVKLYLNENNTINRNQLP